MTAIVRCLIALALVASPTLAQDPGDSDEVAVMEAVPAPAPESTPSAAPAPASKALPAAQVAVRTADELGPSYIVKSISWSVPGGETGTQEEFATRPKDRKVLQAGPVVEAPHQGDTLEITAVVGGRGSGQFAYLDDYRVTLQGTCAIDLAPEFVTEVDVVLVRNAGVLAEFEAGLDIECRSMVMR